MRKRPIALSTVAAVVIGLAGMAPAAAAPSAPVISNLAASLGYLTVTYTPSSGATDHLYSVNGGTPVSGGSTGSITISPLANGQVACVKVFAENADGRSPASNTWCGVPNDPGLAATAQPVITGVTATSDALSVSYTRPDDGFAIDIYQVWLNGVFYDAIEDFASPMTIPGLSADRTYEIQIKAQGPGGAPDSTKSAPYTAATEPASPSSGGATPSIGVPEPPGVTITSVGDGTISFTLVPPRNTGGQIPTSYRFSINGTTTEVGPSNLNHTVTGLANGTTYTITANAGNSAGWSAPGVAIATPLAPLSAPRDVTATSRLNAVDIAWQAPASDGGSPILRYEVVDSQKRLLCTAIAPSTSCSFPETTNVLQLLGFGRDAVTVTAVTAIATASSNRVGLPSATAPGPVRDLRVTGVSRTSARVSWAPPDDAGQTPLGYVVFDPASPSRSFCFGPATSCEVKNLKPGSDHAFGVAAVFRILFSPPVMASVRLAPDRLEAPRNVTAVQDGDRFTVTWEPPANAGATPVGGYRVRLFSDDKTDRIGHLDEYVVCNVGPSVRTCTTDPLRGMLEYNFEVDSLEADGSLGATTKTPYQPLRAMPVPPITLAEAGNGSAKVTVIDRATNPFRNAQTFRVVRVNDWFGLDTTPACTIDAKTSSTCTVTGLANGTGYRFMAYAVNVRGESAAGMPSQVVEPSAAPTAAVRPPGRVLDLRATTRVSTTVPSSSDFDGVKAGAKVTAIPDRRFLKDGVWLKSIFQWTPPDPGGARDVVYDVTVQRWIPGMLGSAYLWTNSCTTRERSCEIAYLYEPRTRLEAVEDYYVTITATNSAGSETTWWQFTSDGGIRQLAE